MIKNDGYYTSSHGSYQAFEEGPWVFVALIKNLHTPSHPCLGNSSPTHTAHSPPSTDHVMSQTQPEVSELLTWWGRGRNLLVRKWITGFTRTLDPDEITGILVLAIVELGEEVTVGVKEEVIRYHTEMTPAQPPTGCYRFYPDSTGQAGERNQPSHP